MFKATFLYAALMVFIYIVLTVRVVVIRKRIKVTLGDAQHPQLQRAIRAHGNFIEYVPFGLLLLMLLESTQKFSVLIHVLAMLLLIGRLLHAFSVSCVCENIKIRVVGMGMTLSVLGVLGVLLLINFFV